MMTKTYPTQKQVVALERFGVSPLFVERLSKAEAKVMLDELVARASAGLATMKQLYCLKKYKLDHRDLTMKEATALLDVLHKNSWKRPDGNIWQMAGIRERTGDP